MSVGPARTKDCPADTLGRLLAESLRALGADRGALLLSDPANPPFRLGAAIGLSQVYLGAVRENWKNIPGSRVMRDQDLLFIRDARSDSRTKPIKAEIEAEGFRSMVLVPLKVGSPPLGNLVLYFDQLRDLSAEEKTSIQRFAELSAIAIENARAYEEVQARLAGQDALRDLTRDITETPDISMLFRRICKSVHGLLRVDLTRFFLMDEPAGVFRVVGSFGVESGKNTHRTLPLGKGIVQRVISSNRPIAVREILEDPDWVNHDWAEMVGLRSLLSIPLNLKGRVIGTLECFTKSPRDFRENEIRLVQDFADQAVVALENARLVSAARRRATSLEILDEIARAINSTLDLGELFRITVEQVKRAVPCERCSLYKVDPGKSAIERLHAADDVPGRTERLVPPSLKGTIFERLLETRAPSYQPDIRKDPHPTRQLLAAEGIRAIINVPIWIDDKCAGFLNIMSSEVDAYTKDHIELLRSLANHLGLAMKNAELYAQTKETGERLDKFVRGATDGILTVDLDGRITSWNPGAEAIYGYAEEEMLGEHITRIYPEGEKDFKAFWEHLISGETVPPFEVVRRRKDGTPVNISLTVSAIKDQRGRIAGFSGVFRDITERKRAEEALRLTQFSVERAADATYWVAPDGRILYVNDAACHCLGYSREELLSKTVSDLSPNYPPEKWAAHWERIKGAGSLTFESHDLTKDGRLVPVEISANYLEFGGKEYCFAFVRDITERKRGEEALRLTQFSLDHAADAVFWGTSCARFAYVNDAACRFWEFSRDELLSMGLYDINPDFQPECWPEEWEKMKQRGSSTFEARHRTKGGRVFPVEITVNFFEFDGEEYRAGFLRDITERKRLEEQLRRSQKLEALGQLASGVAHNFNNSLAIILGRAELSELLTEDPEIRRNLEIIEKAAHDGANTVKRLQDFARKGEDRPTETVRLNDIVSDVIEMTRPRWKDEAEVLGVPFEVGFDARAEKDAVRGKGSELREVLINLVHNALDAMPEGGRLALATKNVEGDVVVSVTDTGIGMSPETLERAQEPFFTTKGDRGTGLGLSMVYGIIARHGGQVTIESAPGTGTTVRLTLPAAAGKTRVLSGPKPVASGPRRILIIEDEEEIAELLAEILKEGGHSAEFATDPRNGLDRFRKETFDVVFTDLSMPEMPGWLVAEEIRRLNPSVPVIMLTGWGAQLDPEQVKASPVDCVLSKPINRADILNSVEKAFAD